MFDGNVFVRKDAIGHLGDDPEQAVAAAERVEVRVALLHVLRLAVRSDKTHPDHVRAHLSALLGEGRVLRRAARGRAHRQRAEFRVDAKLDSPQPVLRVATSTNLRPAGTVTVGLPSAPNCRFVPSRSVFIPSCRQWFPSVRLARRSGLDAPRHRVTRAHRPHW